jgi:acetolactate synthase-1/2/3 large subunit
LNFPTTHDLYGTGPAPKDADALLIIESPIPFMPMDSPRPGAKIAWVDVDPVLSRFKTMEFRADCWLPVDGGAAARAIHDAATGLLTKTDMNKIEERRARLSERRRELERRNEDRAQRAAQRDPFHPFWVGHELGKLLEPDAIVVNDALTGSDGVQAFSGRTEPGTYFCRGASAGGWGCGAAFGAKLARPERDVIHTTGDGFYMFSNPAAALWSSEHYKAPVLTVVFVNGSYGTGTGGARRSYPDGVMARTGNYEGGVFLPPPDFAKLAEAGNGYGETVREAEGVGPALRRGLDQVRKGSPAVIAMMIPSGVDEMTLPEV